MSHISIPRRSALLGTLACVRCLVAYYGPVDLQWLQVDWELTADEVAVALRDKKSKLDEVLAPPGTAVPMLNQGVIGSTAAVKGVAYRPDIAG